MPYSYSHSLKKLPAENSRIALCSILQILTPLRKPIAESTIGLFASCGAQLPEDPPLGETEDISFRLIPRDTPMSRLVVAHKTKVRKWAVEDLNVAFPLERMKELEAEGAFQAARAYRDLDGRINPALHGACGTNRSGDEANLRFARR